MGTKSLTLTGFQERLKNITKIEAAIQSTPISIQIKRYGKKEIRAQLTAMILETSTFFNLGKNINEEQAAETAVLLIEKYPVETLEDFAICFKKAKMGAYGKVYDRLDGHIIFEWFASYLDEKYQVRERLIEEEKKQREAEEAKKAEEIAAIRRAYKTYRYERPKSGGNTLSNSFIEQLRERYKVEYDNSSSNTNDVQGRKQP